MSKLMTTLCVAAVATSATMPVFGIDWSPRAAGTYDWNTPANWTGGAVPTATDTAKLEVPTGNQEINVPAGSAVDYLNVINKRTSGSLSGEGVRTFTGSLTTVSNDFRTGKTVLKGRIDVTGSNQSYTRVGTSGDISQIGILEIADGGIFCATNDHALIPGRHNNGSEATVTGRLVVRDGGQLYLGGGGGVSMSGLMMGRADGLDVPNKAYAIRRSSYFQDGGYALIRRLFVGFEQHSHAGFTVAGGVLELPYTSDTRFRIGHLGYGIFQQFGGDVFVNTNKSATALSGGWAPAESFEIGSNRSINDGRLNSTVYLCGGSFTCGDVIAIQGTTQGENRIAPAADLTIDGDAEVRSPNVFLGINTTKGAAVLNLNGGVLTTRCVRRISTERLGPVEVNGNGGTICLDVPGNPASDHTYHFLGIDRILLYPKGLTIKSDVSTKVGSGSEQRLFRTAKGYGVESVTINSTATDWTEPPLVLLEGGSGSNATAVALIDYSSNRLTNVVVTCRGEGYAADDVLTVKVIKDTKTAQAFASASVTLTPNTPGTLVKTGSNRLVLCEQPDFDGTYEVRQGWLLQSTAGAYGSTNLSALVIGGKNATFQCGSGNESANTAHWNPVNTNATLTLGTEYGPGTFTMPGSHSGAVPFEQSFASLTVNGMGNSIECIYNSAGAGFKLSFGTITCAEGAEVTIPRWNSKCKVYATGMPAGRYLRGVVFAGTTKRAMVGEDGQLVPAPQGVVISFR